MWVVIKVLACFAVLSRQLWNQCTVLLAAGNKGRSTLTLYQLACTQLRQVQCLPAAPVTAPAACVESWCAAFAAPTAQRQSMRFEQFLNKEFRTAARTTYHLLQAGLHVELVLQLHESLHVFVHACRVFYGCHTAQMTIRLRC